MKFVFFSSLSLLFGLFLLSCARNSPKETTAAPAPGLAGGACATSKRFLNDGSKPSGHIKSKMRHGGIELIRYDYKPEELRSLCDKSLEKTQKRIDEIAKGTSKECALLAFEEALTDFSEEVTPLTFMGYVSQNAKLRDAAKECEEKIGIFNVAIFTRKDLYDAIKDLKGDLPETRRLHAETVKAFEQNGLKLPAEKLAEVRKLKEQLSTLETKFTSNLNNDTTKVPFTADELKGVSADFLKRLKKDESGKYVVSTKTTDYLQVMENAKNSETRKRMAVAYNNRAPENTALLEEGILLRQKIASLMGFSTWADLRIWGRMAADGDMVLKFLDGLRGKLKERNQMDLARLAKYKKEVEGNDSPVKAWDLAYLSYQVKKKDYNLDDDKIREYFPAAVVMKGVFQVYSTLLGVRFEEVKNPSVWAPDVKLYAVVDKTGGGPIAHFFTDTVPRDGKYGHAAAFTLRSGRVVNGHYNLPLSSIVCNFNPPANGKPSLMNHDEVETLFHEFGHIMHQILTRAPYASLSGSSVAQDFVEAPSQMLENWVWQPEILNVVSGHYKDPSKKLPPDILKQMLEAKDFNQGYFYTRQLMLGLFDMNLHTRSGKLDSTALYNELYKELIGIEPLDSGHFPAGFGHLMGGYDSGYYGYLWSEVYAQDMFSIFEEKGILNAELGGLYRRAILEKGNTEEPLKLVETFLGRSSNNQAFYKKLGIK